MRIQLPQSIQSQQPFEKKKWIACPNKKETEFKRIRSELINKANLHGNANEATSRPTNNNESNNVEIIEAVQTKWTKKGSNTHPK